MESPIRLASFHPRFGGFGVHHGSAYGYGHAYGAGHGAWITHMVVSSVIHGLIYGAIFRILRHLSLGEIVLLAAVVIAGLYAVNRSRPPPPRW